MREPIEDVLVAATNELCIQLSEMRLDRARALARHRTEEERLAREIAQARDDERVCDRQLDQLRQDIDNIADARGLTYPPGGALNHILAYIIQLEAKLAQLPQEAL